MKVLMINDSPHSIYCDGVMSSIICDLFEDETHVPGTKGIAVFLMAMSQMLLSVSR